MLVAYAAHHSCQPRPPLFASPLGDGYPSRHGQIVPELRRAIHSDSDSIGIRRGAARRCLSSAPPLDSYSSLAPHLRVRADGSSRAGTTAAAAVAAVARRIAPPAEERRAAPPPFAPLSSAVWLRCSACSSALDKRIEEMRCRHPHAVHAHLLSVCLSADGPTGEINSAAQSVHQRAPFR